MILDTVNRWTRLYIRYYSINKGFTVKDIFTPQKQLSKYVCWYIAKSLCAVHKISKDLYLTLLKRHHLATTWLRMQRLDKNGVIFYYYTGAYINYLDTYVVKNCDFFWQSVCLFWRRYVMKIVKNREFLTVMNSFFRTEMKQVSIFTRIQFEFSQAFEI